MGVVTRKHYKCAVCRRDFARDSALVNHTNLAHNVPSRKHTKTTRDVEPESKRKDQTSTSQTSLMPKTRTNWKKATSVKKDTIKIDNLKFKRGKAKTKKDLSMATKFLKLAKHRTVAVKSKAIMRTVPRIKRRDGLTTKENGQSVTQNKSSIRKLNTSRTSTANREMMMLKKTATQKSDHKQITAAIENNSAHSKRVAADFGFSSVSEMFFGKSGSQRGNRAQAERRMVLAVEKMEVPEKMWFVIEEIEKKVAKDREEKQNQLSNRIKNKKPRVKTQQSEQVKENRVGKRAIKRPRKFSFDEVDKDRNEEPPNTSQAHVNTNTATVETAQRKQSNVSRRKSMGNCSGEEAAKMDSVKRTRDSSLAEPEREQQEQQTEEPEQDQREELEAVNSREEQVLEMEKSTQDEIVDTRNGIVSQSEERSNEIDGESNVFKEDKNATTGDAVSESEKLMSKSDQSEEAAIRSTSSQQELTGSEQSSSHSSELLEEVTKSDVSLGRRVIKRPKKFMDEDIKSSYVKKTTQVLTLLNRVTPVSRKRKLEELKMTSKARSPLKRRSEKLQKSVGSNSGNAKTKHVAIETVSQESSRISTTAETINTTESRKGYWCEICSREFSRLAALEKHKKYSHAKQPRFPALKPKINKATSNTTANSVRKKNTQSKASRSNSFKCSTCKKLFARQSNFDAHMQTHYSVPCELCNSKFKDKHQLHRHRVKVHLEDPFSCNLCTDTFLNRELLIAHMRLVHTDLEVHALSEQPKELKSFHCGQCGKNFNTESRYKLHVAQHERAKAQEERRMFKCPQCTLRFRQKSNLTRHLSRTHKDRPHSCKYCNKKFATMPALTVHQNSHREAKETNDALLASTRYLNESNDLKHELTCEMCRVSFSTLDDKKKHMTEIHGNEWTHLCLTCFKVFPNKSMMLRHQIIHKNVHQSVPMVTEVNDSDILNEQHSSNLTPLKSNYLSSSANETDDPPSVVSESVSNLVIEDEVLDSNQVNSIKTEKEKLPQKDVQGANVVSNGVIEDVSKIDSIRCHICKRKFNNHLLLNAHIQKNHMDSTNAPQYKCEICLESFGSFGQYNQHTRTHPETMLFACKFCQERFFTEKRLTHHTNTHHKDQLQEYQCKFCDELFDVSTFYLLQLAIRHHNEK